MRRRKRLSFGPKRKSLKVGPARYNFKGGIPTSTSIGGKSWRLNVGRRGVRTTSRIPGTRMRVHNSLGTKSPRKTRLAPQPTQNDPTKRGCIRGCFPIIVLIIVSSSIVMAAFSLV